MKKSFMAIDLGATSGRTILGSFTPDGLELEEINRFPNHIIEATGHCYWDIYELYRRVIEGLKLAAQKSDVEIVSIGIDTWGVDFVCIGKDGQVLRTPYSYRDPHTEGAPEAFFSRVPRNRVYELTGIQVMNFNSIYQLDVMRRAADSILTITDKILFTPDALSYLLTGQIELIAMSHNNHFLEKDVATNVLWSMIPETKAFCPRGLGIIPYALPGSVKLADATLSQLDDYDVVLWEKHGVFSVDVDIMSAFDQIDVLNKSALIYVAAKSMGFEPDGMTQEQMKEMSVAFNLPK